MCIRLSWDQNNSTILHQVFEAGWTLPAYYHSIIAMEAMTNDQPEAVCLIIDMSMADTPPMRNHPRHHVDENDVLCRFDRVIIVNPGNFMPNITCPIETVNSLAEAYALLETKPLFIPA